MKRIFGNKKDYLKAKEHTPLHYVYIIECSDNSLYTGYTIDLIKRITEHRTGDGAKYTRSKGVNRLVYWECHSNKRWALKREREIKKAGLVYKKMLIKEFNKNLLLVK